MLILREFVFIFTHFWSWFSLWFLFFLSGYLLLASFNHLFSKVSFTLYAFISFLLFSWLSWQLAYLHLFSLQNDYLLLIFWLLFSLVVGTQQRKLLKDKKRWEELIKEFLAFSIFLAFWFWIRGFQPNIIGLEKYMDFGFVNTILRSHYLPAKDMWWVGQPINYYYFGHFLVATFIHLTQTVPFFGYNLGLASIFALSLSLSFFFIYNLLSALKLKKITKYLLSILGSLYLNFASNWQTIYALIAIHLNHYQKTFYWYPDATRFIDYRPGSLDKTIHEFPAYSHIVADLHGHLLALPLDLSLFSLLVIYLLNLQKLSSFQRRVLNLLGGLLIGLGFMTNSWDIMGFGLLWGVAVSLVYFLTWPKKKFLFWLEAAGESFIAFFLTIFLFHQHFHPFFQGFRFVPHHSPLWMWLLLWGQFLLPLFLASLFGWWIKKKKDFQIFIWSSIGITFWLLLFPEVIYLKDIYAADYCRANTMFKLTYQAYIILTLLTPFFISQLRKKHLWFYLSLLSFTLPLSYVFFSFPGYYGHLQPQRWQKGDGFTYLRQQRNGDYQLITFLNRYVPGQLHLVEAVGGGYTQYARISANTGLVTVLGWPIHEWLWRGDGYAPIAARQEEVANFYQTMSPSQRRNFINKYHLRYIILGWEEHQKYPHLDEAGLLKLGKVIYHYRDNYIIEIKDKNGL